MPGPSALTETPAPCPMSLTSEVLKQLDQRPVAVRSCPVTTRSRESLATM
jgi:hypothetical protein